jgi:outer membrane protein assembly factor BamB
MFGRTPDHASYSETEITLTKENVGRLTPAWETSVGAGISVSVTASDGVLYFGSWSGAFYAVNESDGQILWQSFVGVAPAPENPNCFPAIGVGSQASVSDDTVYVGGGDSAVYAFNKKTGDLLWRVQIGDPSTGAYLWSSITVAGGALYIGVASLGDCPLTRGSLVRIDPANPQQPLIRYLMPEGEQGGGVWSTPTYDAASNTIFVTTGTGEQDVERGVWGGSFLALDATTLELSKNYFLLPTNSTEEDIEWGSSPAVFRTSDGRTLVGATGKDGVLYTLNAADLSLAWQTTIAVKCVCPECGCGSLSTPATDGKVLYVGAGVSNPELFDEGTVYAISPDDGSVIWQKTTAGVILAPVTVAGGMVFVSSTNGLEVRDAGTGDLLWTDQQRGMLYSQPVVLNSTVYCTYMNGTVVAWRLGPEQPDSAASTTEP